MFRSAQHLSPSFVRLSGEMKKEKRRGDEYWKALRKLPGKPRVAGHLRVKDAR